MRRLIPLALCAALVAGCDSGSEEPRSAAPPPRDAGAALAGAPAPLAKVHEQGGELLDGGPEAFKARLAELKGYPVVVNKWGSWCPPCRAEFPFFQRQAIERGKQVAFLGVDVEDPEANAREFLRKYPVTFPSYKDPHLKIAAVIKSVVSTPATVFYDSKGEIAYTKQGGYSTERALAEDIERYAR